MYSLLAFLRGHLYLWDVVRSAPQQGAGWNRFWELRYQPSDTQAPSHPSRPKVLPLAILSIHFNINSNTDSSLTTIYTSPLKNPAI